MLWFDKASKKEVQKGFEKVGVELKENETYHDRIKTDCQEIRAMLKEFGAELKELREKNISKKEIELMIREIVLLSHSGQNSGQQFEQNSGVKSEQNQPNRTHYSKVMSQRAIKTRPEVIKQAIRGCLDKDMRTSEIFNLVVEEKKIISKTQFYHYLELVRNELRSNVRTELRTKPSK